MECLYKVKFLIEHTNPLKLRAVIDKMSESYNENAVKIGGSLVIAGVNDKGVYMIKVTISRGETRTIEGLIAPAMRGIVVTVESDNPLALTLAVKDLVKIIKSCEPEVLISMLE